MREGRERHDRDRRGRHDLYGRRDHRGHRGRHDLCDRRGHHDLWSSCHHDHRVSVIMVIVVVIVCYGRRDRSWSS